MKRPIRIALFLSLLAPCLIACKAEPGNANDAADTTGSVSGGSTGDNTASTTSAKEWPSPFVIPYDTLRRPGDVSPPSPQYRADTVPLRSPEGEPARYGIKSGVVVLRYVGGITGERRLAFDDYGMRERKEVNSGPYPSTRPGPIQASVTVVTRDTYGMLDLRAKAGWITGNVVDDDYLNSPESKEVSLAEYAMRKSGAERLPDTVINGYECRVLRVEQPGFVNTIWMWRGIILMEHFIAPMDNMEFSILPVKIEINADVPDSIFTLPEGYPIEQRETPAPGAEIAPPQRNIDPSIPVPDIPQPVPGTGPGNTGPMTPPSTGR